MGDFTLIGGGAVRYGKVMSYIDKQIALSINPIVSSNSTYVQRVRKHFNIVATVKMEIQLRGSISKRLKRVNKTAPAVPDPVVNQANNVQDAVVNAAEEARAQALQAHLDAYESRNRVNDLLADTDVKLRQAQEQLAAQANELAAVRAEAARAAEEHAEALAGVQEELRIARDREYNLSCILFYYNNLFNSTREATEN